MKKELATDRRTDGDAQRVMFNAPMGKRHNNMKTLVGIFTVLTLLYAKTRPR